MEHLFAEVGFNVETRLFVFGHGEGFAGPHELRVGRARAVDGEHDALDFKVEAVFGV